MPSIDCLLIVFCTLGTPADAVPLAPCPPVAASIGIGVESLDGPARGGPFAIAGLLLLARRRHRTTENPRGKPPGSARAAQRPATPTGR